MTLLIRSNIASLNAQRQYYQSGQARDVTIQRTSSGQRINSAKDDAAGLAIADRITSKVRAFSQAARNVNDAVSFALTADAGLHTISDTLQRIRQLTVQAGNETISKSDRAALQGEISDLIKEVGDTAGTSKFNNKNLLDGTLGTTTFQIGAKASDVLGVTIASALPTAIGQRSLGSNQAVGATTISSAIGGSATNTFALNGFAAQTLTISSAATGKVVSGSALNLAAGSSARQVADAINTLNTDTGVSASASTVATISGVTHIGYAQFTLFGSNAGAVPITATINDVNDLSSVARVINAKSGQTGISARADRQGNLVLSQANGFNIGIKNQGAAGAGLDGAHFRGADAVTTLPDGSTTSSAGAFVVLGDASTATNAAQVGGKVELNASSDYAVDTTAAGSFLATAHNSSKFSALASISVQSLSGTDDALKTIDAAIDSVNRSVSAVGALQNRLNKVADQLQSQGGAAEAARSRISDSDYAVETSRLTRSAILQQASTSVLTQANAQARNVLTLLKF